MLQCIECLLQACYELNLEYTFIDNHQEFVAIHLPTPYFFIQNVTPFARSDLKRIMRDKEYAYMLLHSIVHMPDTVGYLNPAVQEEYARYRSYTSLQKIVSAITSRFSFPVIIKKNRGSLGKNVFLCNDNAEILHALHVIYDRRFLTKDYVALAEQYIPIYKEYRVVFFDGQIQFAYIKDTSSATFTGNLSPLHWQNAHSVLVTDKILLQRLSKFIAPIYEKMHIIYTGMDIVEDKYGEFWLLELNGAPGFEIYLRDNPHKEVVNLYKHMLTYLQQNTQAHALR